jgi:hypothetical protein
VTNQIQHEELQDKKPEVEKAYNKNYKQENKRQKMCRVKKISQKLQKEKG